ncbi:MAG: S-methyl-5'-thioadenosine phosphorylase [Candidatus Calescibacterium sp.]|nr:S-methyl-5'-thioadenosine phosphorylase [Candidatus Calescibacterium sp.]MCX7733359.1 S-methyl-5'-thioadenosine phosphorylase [bacterium]MDW8086719.1 S-methyl-5'-thioadenosine phosphorylase [Candidatus Calescibacterium sp.]
MIGIIGGTGLYNIEDLKILEEVEVDTPFGKPSDKIILGELEKRKVAFLPRHSRKHTIPPHRINFRANIFAMKKIGVQRILSVSAVGSMKEHIRPGNAVVVSQFIDMTVSRPRTFFEEGIVVHVGFSDPVCPEMFESLSEASSESGVITHKGGTYICIEGPQFSSRAMSKLWRQFGVDVIGMTNLPEAYLAREAEICYATLAFPTDYDCWYEGEEIVTAQMVVENLKKNIEKAKKILRVFLRKIPDERKCHCKDSLKDAIVTAPENIPQETKDKLRPIIGRYIKS